MREKKESPMIRRCPQCGADPFVHFMRHNVYRSGWLWFVEHPKLRAWADKKGWKVWCVICDNCKNIVGYEPGPLEETRRIMRRIEKGSKF